MEGNLGTSAQGTTDPDVMDVARGLSRDLSLQGAQAVLLFGSHARGDSHPESDVDILSLGRGPEYSLRRHGKFLLSLSWRTPEEVRDSFRQLRQVGEVIPGWREAVILHDPDGVAARLQQEAREWSWDELDAHVVDAGVADWVTGLAEEVHKFIACRDRGLRSTMAVQRSVLALRLAGAMALHHRILYGSENHLWDLVAARIGAEWTHAQAAALSMGGESLEESCRAALRLYVLAAGEAGHLFTHEQSEVVDHACGLARTAEG